MKYLIFLFCFLPISFTSLEKEDAATPAFAIRYVTPSGSSGNSGVDEANAWSFNHADSNAQVGDVVYVKAGNYGALNLTFTSSGVDYIGYVNTPGDIVSTQYSTVTNTQAINVNQMPTLSGVGEPSGTAIQIVATNVKLENIQIQDYRIGISGLASGTALHLKNIALDDLGTNSTDNTTTTGDPYDGFGIFAYADKTLIENCIVRNAKAEAINTKGSDDGIVRYSEVYADNTFNPCDYYIIASGGSDGWLIEHNKIYRTQPLIHGGHGLMTKDLATNNVFRNNHVTGTSLEANFSGSQFNIWEDITMVGYGTDSNNWHTRIYVANGAQDNIFRRISISDSYYTMILSDYDDGFVGTGGDRDLDRGGDNNTFEDIVAINSNVLIQNTGFNTPSDGNVFRNITAYNVNKVLVTAAAWTNFELYNIGIHTQNTGNPVGVSGSLTLTTGSNNLIYNASGTLPSWLTTSTDPLFTNVGGIDLNDYQLQSGSPWIGAGISGVDVGYIFSAQPSVTSNVKSVFGFME